MVGDSVGQAGVSFCKLMVLVASLSCLRTYTLPEIPTSINPLDDLGLLFAANGLDECPVEDHLASQFREEAVIRQRGSVVWGCQ